MSEADDRLWALVDEFIGETGDFVPAIVSQKLVAKLEESDPDLLAEWLHEHANHFVTVELGYRERSRRTTARAQSKRRAFGDAADSLAAGDAEPISHFSVTYDVDDEHTRRRVGDMTGADHKFVADRYQASGSFDLMLAAFHRQVAKAVGKRATEDVLTEEKYDEMLQSVTRKSA